MKDNDKPFDGHFSAGSLSMQPRGIDMMPLIRESLRLKPLTERPTDETTGFFEYIPADEGWGDSFRIVDDDGMPFSLDGLRRFDGRAVKITIEWDEEAERRADEQDGNNAPPYVYKMIGQTAPAYTRERKRRQSEFEALRLKQEKREK